MTQTDKSLVEHLATRVMGWNRQGSIYLWFDSAGHPIRTNDINLDSWADAGQVWEKAREMGHTLTLLGFPDEQDKHLARAGCPGSFGEAFSASGPRAICEAVARATGYQGKEEE
jgi:hypothetical protein